jgi:hypothetical protein
MNATLRITQADFPPSLQSKINSTPLAGDGLHAHLCTVKNELRHQAGWTRQDGYDFLYQLAIDHGRDNRTAHREAKELTTAEEWQDTKLYLGPSEPLQYRRSKEEKPVADPALIRQIVAAYETSFTPLYDLWEASPLRFDENDSRVCPQILAELFEPEELVFLTCNERRGEAQTTSEWLSESKRLGRMSHLIPNPLKSRQPTNSHYIARSDDNISYRRWIVVEFDFSRYGRDGKTPTKWMPLLDEWEASDLRPKDAQVILLGEMSRYGKLAMVVDSGGKSLHGWFPALSMTSAHMRSFIRYAITLGADPALRTPSQLFRMPHGMRAISDFLDITKQPVLYYNPTIIHQNRKQ